MAVTKFQQIIWSKKIQDELERKTKLVGNCTTKYEGDCKFANTVKILAVGDPTVSPYTGEDINIEEMSDTDQLLAIDVQNYFAFKVNDVDKAQSVPGLDTKYQKKAVHKLAVKRDEFIGKLVAGKAQSTAQETATTFAKTSDSSLDNNKDYYTRSGEGTPAKPYKYTLVLTPNVADIADYYEATGSYKDGATNKIVATGKTQAAIKSAIDNAIVGLRERDYEGDGVIEIPPSIYNIFKNNLIELSTNNVELINRGVVGRYDTYEVVMSNSLYKDARYNYCMVRSKEAVAFAGQINEVEAGRMEKQFSDYIRGLDTFGAKIISQAELELVQIPV